MEFLRTFLECRSMHPAPASTSCLLRFEHFLELYNQRSPTWLKLGFDQGFVVATPYAQYLAKNRSP